MTKTMITSKNSEEIITKETFIYQIKQGGENFSGKIFNFEINHGLLIEVMDHFKKEKNITEKTKGIFRDKEGKKKIVVKSALDFSKSVFHKKVDFSSIIFLEEIDFSHVKFLKYVNFTYTKFEKEAKFKETTFEDAAIFRYTNFLDEDNFIGAKFLKEANFLRAKFSYEPYWGKTEFKDQRDFRGIKIDGIKEFSEEEFVKKLKKSQGFFKKRKFNFEIKPELFKDIFKNKTINIGLDFSNVVFLKKADFTGLKFEKKVNFYKTTFEYTAIFSDTDFRKNSEEKYKNSEEKFKLRKNELDKYIVEVLRGLVGVNFEQAVFKGEARFKEAKFLSKANFYKTEFLDTANFNTAIFKDEIHFGHANFESIVHFSNAQLLKDTDFTFAVFKGLTTFRETKFENKLSFYKTKFADHVNFNESQFKDCSKEAVVFGKTEFSKELDFENIIIEGDNPLKFNSVIFSRQYLTDFCKINEKKKTKVSGEKEPALLIFEDISFPSEFVFSRCRLAKTEFLDCIIEKAKFLNCTFLNSSFSLNPFKRDRFYVAGESEKDKRKSWIIVKFVWAFLLFFLPIIYFFSNFVGVVCVLVILLFFISGRGLYLFYDEKKKNKNQDNEDQEQLIRHREDQEQLSRQMKSSLEASKSWKQAGDFYIGELELRRKKNGWSYFGLSIYKYYLGYAERFTVILFWIFALFFYTTSFNYKKNLDYFKEIKLTEDKINMLAMETGYSEECIEATNNSLFIRVCFFDSIKKSANLLIFPLTLRTQTKGFETLSDVLFVMLSWPVWLAFFVAIKRRFRF